MPSLLRPALSSTASSAGCSREYESATAKLSMVSGKAIEETSVEFGCVEGEVEEGGRSGGGGGNGAHLGLTRSPEKQAVNARPFSGAPRLQPPIFFPRLISAEELLSNQKWDSYPQYHHTGDVPASHQVRNHPHPHNFSTGLSKVSTTRTRSPPPRLLGGAVSAVMNL